MMKTKIDFTIINNLTIKDLQSANDTYISRTGNYEYVICSNERLQEQYIMDARRTWNERYPEHAPHPESLTPPSGEGPRFINHRWIICPEMQDDQFTLRDPN